MILSKNILKEELLWKLVVVVWDPISVEKGNKALFIRVWKSLPSKRVLKPRGEAWKRKPKKDNIC